MLIQQGRSDLPESSFQRAISQGNGKSKSNGKSKKRDLSCPIPDYCFSPGIPLALFFQLDEPEIDFIHAFDVIFEERMVGVGANRAFRMPLLEMRDYLV